MMKVLIIGFGFISRIEEFEKENNKFYKVFNV